MVGIENWSWKVTEMRVLLAPWRVKPCTNQPSWRSGNSDEAEKLAGAETEEKRAGSERSRESHERRERLNSFLVPVKSFHPLTFVLCLYNSRSLLDMSTYLYLPVKKSSYY